MNKLIKSQSALSLVNFGTLYIQAHIYSIALISNYALCFIINAILEDKENNTLSV